METVLKPGMVYEKTETVSEKNIASTYQSGLVDVYATPAMVALMENVSLNCVDPYLPDGWLTVGTSLDVKHFAATPLGMTVRAKAELLLVEGRNLTFKVEVYDEKEKIGEGTHGRFIINRDRFMARVAEKKNKE